MEKGVQAILDYFEEGIAGWTVSPATACEC